MKKNEQLLGLEMPSPVGPLTLLAGEKGVAGVYFEARWQEDYRSVSLGENVFLDQAKSELAEYFAGERTRFEVALAPEGTAFQLVVWEQLARIPFGEVVSYKAIAERINNPKAVRAVGLANGANPISIIVPCHRVIGANGKLTGYGGGLERKKKLLNLEAADELFA